MIKPKFLKWPWPPVQVDSDSDQMERRFHIGDVVQLKSGGHPMTVIGLEGGCCGNYHLVWLPDKPDNSRLHWDDELPFYIIPDACLRAYQAGDEIPF